MNELTRLLKQFVTGLITAGLLKGNSFTGVQEEVSGVQYDKNGYSTMTKHGGVRIKVLDALIDSWIKKGGVHKFVAEQQDRYYVFLQPGIEYTPYVENQILRNQGDLAFAAMYSGLNIQDYYKMRGMYENLITGEEIFGIPNTPQRESGEWKKIKNRQESIVEDHAVIAESNYSMIDSRHYKDFLGKHEKFLLAKMERERQLIVTNVAVKK